MRINKYLASQSLGSRREIDQAVERGLVVVNGVKATLGQRLYSGDKVSYKGTQITYQDDKVQNLCYIAFYKPKGVVCTCDKKDPDNIIDHLKHSSGTTMLSSELRLFPIGRLDKDSRGLILLTNDGSLTYKLTHPKFKHEKEYLVTCANPLTKEFLDKFSSGVKITRRDSFDDMVLTKACKVRKLNDKSFSVILTQGYKRQIRKMTKALGNEVVDLLRVRIDNIVIKDYFKIESKPTAEKLILELKEGEFKLLAAKPFLQTISSPTC